MYFDGTEQQLVYERTREFVRKSDEFVFTFFQLFFFQSEISGEFFIREIEFARLVKFDKVSTFREVKKSISEKCEEVASILSNAVNHSFVEAQVQLDISIKSRSIVFEELRTNFLS